MLSWLVHVDAAAPVPRARRARSRLGHAAGVAHVSVVPPDDCHRHAVHRHDALRQLLALARHAVHQALAAVVLRVRRRPGVRGERSRLGRGRSRPAAVDRLSDDDRRRPRRRPADERRRLRSGHRANRCSASIIMFGVVYLLLFVLWIMLLNNKIQHGPGAGQSDRTNEAGRIDRGRIAATRPRGSLTEPKRDQEGDT